MPNLFLERVPLPSLKTYTAISVALLSLSVYFVVQISSDPNWKVNNTSIIDVEYSSQNDSNASIFLSWIKPQNGTLALQVQEIVYLMMREPFCLWTLVNMAYCCLLLLGTLIQKVVFGELRVSEQQQVKDKFWNFIFYKFLLVTGVINVQFKYEIVFWFAWFSVLGFLNHLALLGRDRFEYLSISPTTSGWNHVRLLGLLVCIFLISGVILLVCVEIGFFVGFHTFAFMAAEYIELNIRTLHFIVRYVLHLYDLKQGHSNISREKRGFVAYYAEFIFELTVLVLDFAHHIHMILWSNILVSVASLVICLQLRHLFYEIQRMINKHMNYLRVLNHMEQNYPMATPEELSNHKDHCAICWEVLDSARKLPCTHLFHNACLQSWLEQDTSCPTCRMVLTVRNRNVHDSASRLEHSLDNGDNQPTNRRPPNHFFHFDGSRYVSWLPSFSVEVTHMQIRNQVLPIQNSQFDAMARQVQQVFPNIPLSVVMDDLRVSRSVELTVENILEGRITVSPHMYERESTPTPPPPTLERRSEVSESVNNSIISSDSCSDSRDSEEIPEVSESFPESSAERERLLRKRKEKLILSARRKYIGRCKEGKTEATEES